MKGINFIEPLHRVVASGQKTQARRLIKAAGDIFPAIKRGKREWKEIDRFTGAGKEGYASDSGQFLAPRYKAGETLYLKEPYHDPGDPATIYKYDAGHEGTIRWKNKLFMPATRARHFIEITAVRVERLQEISDEDCMKEGIRKRERESNEHGVARDECGYRTIPRGNTSRT